MILICANMGRLPHSPKSRKRYLQATAEECQRIGQVPPIDFFLNFGKKIQQEASLVDGLKQAFPSPSQELQAAHHWLVAKAIDTVGGLWSERRQGGRQEGGG